MKKAIPLAALILTIALSSSASAISYNPFGIMPGRQAIPEYGADLVEMFGVAYYRPTDIFAGGENVWNGNCVECDAAKDQGLELLLTVRYGGEDKMPSSPVPEEEMDNYRQKISDLLDAYEPELLVVENEENSASFYYDGTELYSYDTPDDGVDTVAQYQQVLEAACDVAHEKGYKCTNGGLTSEATATLAWWDYLEQGRIDEACEFAKKAFYTEIDPNAGEQYCQVQSTGDDRISQEMREKIETGLRLIDVYRDSSNDYTNFHWYIHDPDVLAQSIDYMRAATGKDVLINEIGQWDWDDSEEYVRPLLNTIVEKDVLYAVWFSIKTGGATSLTNPDGTLLPSGEEFQEFVKEELPGLIKAGIEGMHSYRLVFDQNNAFDVPWKTEMETGAVQSMTVDTESKSLTILLERSASGQDALYIELPASLISTDGKFTVTVDGAETDYEQLFSSPEMQGIAVPLPAGASEVRVFGVSVVPEFSAPAILAAATAALIIMARRKFVTWLK